MKKLSILIPLLTIFFSSITYAQDEYYVWTHLYETNAADEFELESNSFLFTPSLSGNRHSAIQQFELQYGVTDRFQLGFYQVFSQDFPAGRISAESFMVEALYKLAQKGEFTVDPLLYLEYARDWNFKSPNHVEARLILSKDFGPLNGTVNGIAEYEFGGRKEFTPELCTGISYEIVEGFRAGVETFVTLSNEDETADEDLAGTGVGPTLAVATPWFNIISGVTFGITRASNAVNFCTTIGFDL